MKLTRNELEKILANLIKRDYLIFAEEQIEITRPENTPPPPPPPSCAACPWAANGRA